MVNTFDIETNRNNTSTTLDKDQESHNESGFTGQEDCVICLTNLRQEPCDLNPDGTI